MILPKILSLNHFDVIPGQKYTIFQKLSYKVKEVKLKRSIRTEFASSVIELSQVRQFSVFEACLTQF